MFFVYNKKPYFVVNGMYYRCSLSADKVEVDFKEPATIKHTPSVLYTEEEIKRFLGICFIDSWDETKKKVIKISNQTISSLKSK